MLSQKEIKRIQNAKINGTKGVDFNKSRKKYGWLSSEFLSKMTVYGKEYASVEHFLQSLKYSDRKYMDIIRTASTPNIAVILGTQQMVKGPAAWQIKLRKIVASAQKRGVRPKLDWDSIKTQVMYIGVLAKFTQNLALKKKLLETGLAVIKYDSSQKHWGGSENWLGVILMAVREKLA